MADDERGSDGPSLELPSLSFGRKRRTKAPEVAPEPAPEATPEPAPAEPASAEPAPAEDARQEQPTEVLAATPAPVAPVAPEQATPPLFADEAPARRAPAARPPVDAPPAKPPRRKREFTLPALGGMAAAVVTGLLVGVITVGLTWASLRLCEAVKGTSSCGGPGFLLLLAIVIAMIVLGGALLRAWGVSDPGSTSFLAVGLLAVLVLLFLVDALFNWWMILVIPVFSVLTFALSHWVTTSFVEPADR